MIFNFTKKRLKGARFYATKAAKDEKVPFATRKSHYEKITRFFTENKHLALVKGKIPDKYFMLKRITAPENLYLVDEKIAKKAVSYILPDVKNNEDQIVSETNAGLGLIAKKLLENGVNLVRLYESCSEFKTHLIDFCEDYPNRVELFTKDIFLLHRYDYIDKQDHGNRVQQLLKGVPLKPWTDDPVMTIIGTLPNNNFIRYLIKCLVLQGYPILLGRIQIYAFMRPRDYIVLTAGPHVNLHTYQRWSVLFKLFFESELLDKFPRSVFLPWQSIKDLKVVRYASQIDPDLMYFVRINLKKDLPVSIENLLALYAFVTQFFGKGNNRIIPILEKWVPGSGLDVIIPKLKHEKYFENINIFTKFGELTPDQILYVFREMMTNSDYKKSHFMNIIESQLMKTETIETSLDEQLEKTIVESIEMKLD